MRTKTLPVKDKELYNLSQFANFSKTGSITGMKKKYFRKSFSLSMLLSYKSDVTGV